MFQKIYPATESIIGNIIGFAQKRAWFVIVCAIGTAFVTASYTLKNLAINTDTEEMLSENLPWRVTFDAYKREFPYFSDYIVIVVDGATIDIARDSAAQLANALRTNRALINNVFYPTADKFLRRHQLLYLDPEQLEALTDKLSEAQPFLARLSRHRSSASLFDLLNDALDAPLVSELLDVAPAITQIATAIDELNRGNNIPMSWQTLLMGTENMNTDVNRVNREIIVIQPSLDFSALLPAEPAIIEIKQLIADLRFDRQHGIEVRLTGPAALSFDELNSVITGSQNAGTLALLMIVVCLLIGLRSLSLVIATLATLIIGLIFTAGFAVVCVGTLNMISIAFAVLYVGLGVDFAIHICLRYREMLSHHSSDFAVTNASRHVGMSLILCALTTSIGFFSFIPTAYRGVAELGLIAGVGMFISFALSIGVLPALLHVLPAPNTPRSIAVLPDRLASFPRRNSRGVLAVATIVWVLAALCIPFTHFDLDPINLNDQKAESVVTFRDLMDAEDTSPLPISAAVDSSAQARKFIDELEKLPAIKSVQSIDSFLPDDQDEKLALIDDLALILGPDLELEPHEAAGGGATLLSIDNLLARIDASSQRGDQDRLSSAAQSLADALKTYQSSIQNSDPTGRHQALRRLDEKLLRSFAGRVELLRDSLTAQSVGVNSLPENIRERWLSKSGQYRIEAYPTADITRAGETKRFVHAARTVLGDRATGTPVINISSSDAVKSAFVQAFSYAFIVITVLLWIILRSLKEVGIVLSPLILAGLLTSAASVVFSLPFNFANIIALPLLLGIGVDSALHIL
ncbi:MAG: MMPL family transporter, partial [Gammaproteobacteria bacterium]